MGETKTVAFRVGEDQKDNWDQAVSDSEEYDSLSHLIRRAVERELAGGFDPTGGSTESDPRLDTLTEAVERIDTNLKGVSDAVSRLEERTYEESGITDETLETVYSVLPTGEGNAVDGSGHPSAIADEAGYTEARTEMVLEQLKHDMKGTVDKVEIADVGPHYFRRA